tara:strand:- start:332 stop:568 length:237 start_codon:yes stop_codon:yes gene_type:complete
MIKDKRMYDKHIEHADDMSYENEGVKDFGPMVQISIKEYDRLKEKSRYITDKDLIAMIDKLEFFVKELRKHIVRIDIE